MSLLFGGGDERGKHWNFERPRPLRWLLEAPSPRENEGAREHTPRLPPGTSGPKRDSDLGPLRDLEPLCDLSGPLPVRAISEM